jgi:predicted LPLAT superfamily acyltransferase
MYNVSDDATEKFHARYRRVLQDVRIISTTDPLAAGVKIMAALRRGEVVCIRADRTLGGRAVEATLLGEPVRLPAGPFLAAALTDAPVLAVYTAREGYRRYVCRVTEARRYGETDGLSRDAQVTRAAQEFATSLDGMLRRFPLQWANFYDFWNVQRARGSSVRS